MSECAKASQYAFIFLYTSIFRVFWGREILCFQSVLPKMQPPPAGLMHRSWAVSWPDALPVLEQAEEKADFLFYFF